MELEKEIEIVEAPCVTFSGNKEDRTFTLHNYVNLKGKLVLDKQQAMLLYLKLHKFIMEE